MFKEKILGELIVSYIIHILIRYEYKSSVGIFFIYSINSSATNGSDKANPCMDEHWGKLFVN